MDRRETAEEEKIVRRSSGDIETGYGGCTMCFRRKQKVRCKMIKVTVLFGDSMLNCSYQEKTFKDEASYCNWCTKNYAKIMEINGHPTYQSPMNSFDLL